jgi:hypothetical protein
VPQVDQKGCKWGYDHDLSGVADMNVKEGLNDADKYSFIQPDNGQLILTIKVKIGDRQIECIVSSL